MSDHNSLQVATPETAYGRFKGGRLQGKQPPAILLPLWIPHAIRAWKAM
jgi:hypothetical protein